MNNWDINILVNGNRCKQYQHQGKTFIQANQGSEYCIEIKNNYWKRILAVSSVDGLNVLTGKTASENDTGYIIDAYHAEKIKGFRFSDDEWAMFKFGYKFYGNTYAQSKGDGSEKNCGVIGVRLFYESEPVITWMNSPIPQWNQPITPTPWNPFPSYVTCHGTGGMGISNASYTSNVNFMASNLGSETLKSSGPDIYDGDCDDTPIACAAAGPSIADPVLRSCKMSLAPEPKGYDMGTEWGRKEHSKVNTVTFEKGCLAHTFDIYYASRESLIEMGVPITNQLKVNTPQSFPEKYAQPPKNWVG